jgi:hypothetical protein
VTDGAITVDLEQVFIPALSTGEHRGRQRCAQKETNVTKEELDELAKRSPDEALAKVIEEWGGEPPMAGLLRGFDDIDEVEPMVPYARELLRTAIVPKARALMVKLQAVAMSTGSVAPDNDARALGELLDAIIAFIRANGEFADSREFPEQRHELSPEARQWRPWRPTPTIQPTPDDEEDQ